MHLPTLLLGLAATSTLAQQRFSACVTSCTTSSPVSSQCDGDEQGAALDRCTCASFTGSLLIDCIRACPEADQAEYADDVVPELCRGDLFPGVSGDASGTAAGTTTAASTSAGAETRSETGTTTAASTASSTGEASQTSEEAAGASETGDGDSGAVGREIAGLLLAGGIVAAMIV